MSEMEGGSACVLLPVATGETWAVPQNCLAEILTVHTTEEAPPRQVERNGVGAAGFAAYKQDDPMARIGIGFIAAAGGVWFLYQLIA